MFIPYELHYEQDKNDGIYGVNHVVMNMLSPRIFNEQWIGQPFEGMGSSGKIDIWSSFHDYLKTNKTHYQPPGLSSFLSDAQVVYLPY